MKAALAHECNHNVRYQFIQWDHTVTLGELIVSEGLAENFATSIFGKIYSDLGYRKQLWKCLIDVSNPCSRINYN